MNVSIEKKRADCAALPKGWQREEVLRKTGLSAGKVDVYYYSPTGKKIESKPQLARALGDTIDLSTFDYQAGRIVPNATHMMLQHNALKRKLGGPVAAGAPLVPSPTLPPPVPIYHQFSSGAGGRQPHQQYEYSRGMRADTSLIPPIRQTASIFKQPVTVVRSQDSDSKVKRELQHGSQIKPKQLFWEKRLENLRANNTFNEEIGSLELPKRLKAVGPGVNEATVLQSLATALHHNTHPVTGQTASKTSLNTNAGVFLNPDQPLMHVTTVTEDDIKRQEERVQFARSRLQEALRA
ncbi:methyl-CpG-binding domain protein 2 isoform X1 [Topomyia yanbarensis]|uniref:methyl-CpG-binding domain protein 2 isoform X1 n=1 Tax=Topomyia yanbarensis TaxID=2498891 RepID=UPI00273AB2A9|nr:methyl-CpG-binding domain protein 2 isoform X1 [Topomyia yanbarensis]